MKKTLRRHVRACLALAVCISALAACSSGGSSSAGSAGSSTGKFVIADDDELSGDLAIYGQYELTYLRAAVDYVNAHGGIDGHQVEIVTGDDAATGQTPASVFQQLVAQYNPVAVFGFTISNDCGAVAPLAASHQIPIICHTVPPSDISPVQKYVFGATDIEAQEVGPTVQFVQDFLKLKPGSTFATYVEGAVGDETYATEVASALQKAGYKLVDDQLVPITTVDTSPEVSKVVSTRPDFVLVEMNSAWYPALVHGLQNAGDNATIIGIENSTGFSGLTSIMDPNLYAIVKSEYLTTEDPSSSGSSLIEQALKLVNMTSLTQMNEVLGPEAFVAPYDVLQALKACGYPCSGPKLASDLTSVTVSLPGLVPEPFGFTESLHIGFRGFDVYAYDPATKLPGIVEAGLPVGSVDG